MRSANGLGPIVREEAERGDLFGRSRLVRPIGGADDEVDEAIEAFLELEAEEARCSTRVVRLPERRLFPYIGTEAGTIRLHENIYTGWTGWHGAYSYREFFDILRSQLDQHIFGQNCMVYRYRFDGVALRSAGYIGSATGRVSLGQRLSLEIRINHPDSGPVTGSKSPTGLTHIINRLQTAASRTSFRLDIGSIVAPGIRNSFNVFILEKILQRREQTLGNPRGIRSFEDFEDRRQC